MNLLKHLSCHPFSDFSFIFPRLVLTMIAPSFKDSDESGMAVSFSTVSVDVTDSFDVDCNTQPDRLVCLS